MQKARAAWAAGYVLCLLPLAASARAAELLVADPGHSDIRRFDSITGAYLGSLGDSTTLFRSREFDVGADGAIYVANFDFAHLVKLDAGGNLLKDVNVQAQGRPVYARLGPDGLLYVNASLTDGIIRYNPGTLDLVDVLPVVNQQTDFRFGPDGNLYVVNRDTHAIDVFDPRTKQYVDWNPGTPQRDPFVQLTLNSSPGPIVFGPDGDLFELDFRKIVRYDGQTGASFGDFVPSPAISDPNPVSMAFGPEGNMYVSYDNAQVLRYSGDDGHLLGTFISAGTDLQQVGGMLFVPEPGGITIVLGMASLLLANCRRRAA